MDPDLLADLVGEQADRVGAVEVAGQLAQRLRHQPRLQADLGLPHLALQLGARDQRGDRVDGDHVDGAGADQHVDDLQRLLAVVGLGDQQLVGVDADPARVDRVDRVLGVDEGADPAARLGLGDDVVDQRRLARGLGAEDLDDPALAGRRRPPAPGPATAPRSGSPRPGPRRRRRAASPSPAPNWRSIWVTAASSAASFALASFAEASFKFACFSSAISSPHRCPGPVLVGSSTCASGVYSRTRRLEDRTVESDPDAFERGPQRLRERPRRCVEPPCGAVSRPSPGAPGPPSRATRRAASRACRDEPRRAPPPRPAVARSRPPTAHRGRTGSSRDADAGSRPARARAEGSERRPGRR